MAVDLHRHAGSGRNRERARTALPAAQHLRRSDAGRPRAPSLVQETARGADSGGPRIPHQRRPAGACRARRWAVRPAAARRDAIRPRRHMDGSHRAARRAPSPSISASASGSSSRGRRPASSRPARRASMPSPSNPRHMRPTDSAACSVASRARWSGSIPALRWSSTCGLSWTSEMAGAPPDSRSAAPVRARQLGGGARLGDPGHRGHARAGRHGRHRGVPPRCRRAGRGRSRRRSAPLRARARP